MGAVVRITFLLAVLTSAGAVDSDPKDEVIALPKMEVKGLPITSYGIGVAGTRDPVTKKVRRLFVSEVLYGTPAARFGLREQDEILAINGVSVKELDALMQPGSQLFDLLVNRPNNETIVLDVLTRQRSAITLKSQNVGALMLAPKHSYPPVFISVSIARSPADVYAFAANPKNLAKWSSPLGAAIKSDLGEWFVNSPAGKVKVKFAPKNEFGVLDYELIPPSGESLLSPLRVQANGSGSEIVFTFYRLPLASTEDADREISRMRQDLARLKVLLEH